MYQYQLNVLPEHGFRCIMDIRGNGQSDKPWTGYTYDRLADDIAIVLEALQVENATLVGFSVGGALLFAICLAIMAAAFLSSH